jgi:hypothetical protein
MPAKTYHIILADSTLVFEAEYLVRVKAIGDWAVSQAGLSGWNSKSLVELGQEVQQHHVSISSVGSTSYAKLAL